ncbi:MAG: tetratricopeptide repeat protein [Acidobacteria bacterium]|nr:tetratricopeptide repeat protein [Candidatus Sulfomarinibacter kjeldsenii]MBD3857667.1 tetratricopeptide repeat protein [Candidatus Sulfomarinibacter kjeldsenii]
MRVPPRRNILPLGGWSHHRVLRALAYGLFFAGFAQAGIVAAESQEVESAVLEAVEIGAVKAHIGGLLLSGQAGGDVEGALIWSLAGRDESGRVEVPYVLEVDGGKLLEGRSARRMAIGIYAYVMDGEGRVVDYIAQGLVLSSETYRDRISSSGLKFAGRFVLDPGDYTLRVMVENSRTGNYFMSWSILTVPAAEDLSPQLLPPLFPDPETPWIVARQNGVDTPFALGNGAGILPAARPTLVENQPAEVYLGGGGWDESAVIGIRILNEIGRTVFEPVVRFDDSPYGDFKYRRIALTPVDLPPGEYRLVVTLADENIGEVLRRATRLTVVSQGQGRGWAGAGDPAIGASASASSEGSEDLRKLKKKDIRAAYRRALRPLGDGDPVAARQRVAELERLVVTGPSRSSLAILSEAELAEAKALAKANPTCLMPLALLHRDLYRGYSARREGLLSSHAREMAIAFAEELGREKPYFGFSEGLMVNFASDLAQTGASGAARALLEQALRLNRGFRPAMLSLGFSYERSSDHLEAASTYQSLVDTHPGFEEGRLRLAINLIRTGRDGAGEELLRGLVGTGAMPWIEAIAAQELVRVKSEKMKLLPDAELEVRAALELMPDDQRLWILLAAILEQLGRHDEALEALSDLPPAGRGVSPRARYAEWPALDVRASQAHLNARASEAVPALKTALAAGGAS